MALRDYVICGECETKIIYDGYDNGRDRLEEVWGDPNADVWTVHLLCPDCIKKLQADLATARAQYNELIMAVAQKHPNESRHETALRYIRQAEQNSLGDTGSKLAGKDKP